MHTMLEHAGETIENPTDADLARVLTGPRDDDWFIALFRDGDSMEVMLDAGELWVEVTEEARFVQARSQLTQDLVQSMLVSFRDRDHAWRDMALWKEPPPPRKQTLLGPAGAILALVGLLAASFIAYFVTKRGGWMIVGFALLFPGIVAAAIVTKMAEARRAASWTKASGRITRSEIATETGTNNVKTEVPRIEYEFRVGFHTLAGKRVNLAEKITGAEARAAVARYPVGASVTVYYDPENPSQALLERELPAFVHSAWGIVAALTALIVFIAWWYLVR